MFFLLGVIAGIELKHKFRSSTITYCSQLNIIFSFSKIDQMWGSQALATSNKIEINSNDFKKSVADLNFNQTVMINK
jgi:hypothetical protein